MRRALALAGFMGTGKSTVGRAVAARVIPEIFAEEGEAGFRVREAASLARVAAGPPVVLALGGGTLHQPRAVAALTGWAVVVLHAPLEVVAARLGEGGGRPLAPHAAALFEARAAGYRAAGPQVDATRPVPYVVDDVLAAWEAACAST
jgi:shikimate kinase